MVEETLSIPKSMGEKVDVSTIEYLNVLRTRLSSLTKELESSKLYWLQADEGGMIGTPRYIITPERVKRMYFEPFLKATPSIIRNFIANSIIAWAATKTGDFSQSFEIEILK